METKDFMMGYAAGKANGGGSQPTGTIQISTNGTHNVAQYASAEVNVPNSYAAGDEGKVVHQGTLVSQGSDTATANGTVDTTLISSLTVAIPSANGEDF